MNDSMTMSPSESFLRDAFLQQIRSYAKRGAFTSANADSEGYTSEVLALILLDGRQCLIWNKHQFLFWAVKTIRASMNLACMVGKRGQHNYFSGTTDPDDHR